MQSLWSQTTELQNRETLAGVFGKKEKRCSHMGCALSWNEEEEIFECACHGSRFDKMGNVLDNPAKKGTSLAIDRSKVL